MASCTLGASNIKLSKLDFGRATVSGQQQRSGARVRMGRGQMQPVCMAISLKSRNAFSICCRSSPETEMATKETKSSGLTSQLIPNSSELGGFRLYVMRDFAEKSIPTPQPLPPPPPPAPASPPVTVGTNGSASKSLAISKQKPSSEGIQSFLDRAADEGLMILRSPSVGIFQRCRTIKGKRAPPSCKEKQIVKEGQVLCFIEQLGGELPIESEISGEVIKILRKDGEPVGYGDALIAVLPSFPGIKKLQ